MEIYIWDVDSDFEVRDDFKIEEVSNYNVMLYSSNNGNAVNQRVSFSPE